MGAKVTVITRPDSAKDSLQTPFHDGKHVRALDLKTPLGVADALDLVAGADALIEGNRPGVMERLGLGPAECAARNVKLVYGRITGWGQEGPLAHSAGARSQLCRAHGPALACRSPGVAPRTPPALAGDGAGALGLAFGIACALLDARACGRGCIVDAAMTDITAMLGSLTLLARSCGFLDGHGGSVFHDSPFYDSYLCADGAYVTICALEPPFYSQLLTKLGLNDVDPRTQYARTAWPRLKARVAAMFLTRAGAEWQDLLEETDVCFAPVLSLEEAARHPHNLIRGTYTVSSDGKITAAIAPRMLPLPAGPRLP